MKHLFVFLSLLLTWGSAQAQNEKQTPVTKLPGEENLSLRERAERDFLMPVRRKKVVAEAPKASIEDNTAAPESDATAHYAEVTDEAAIVPARSYEVRHSEALAARRAEARAEARRIARHSSKSKAHKATSHSSSKSKSSKSKSKSKSAAHSSKSTSKSKGSKANRKTTHSNFSKAKKTSAKKRAAHIPTKKSAPSKTKSKTKRRR